MADSTPGTDPNTPTPGTGEGDSTPPAATPPSDQGGAASPEDIAAAKTLLESQGHKVLENENYKNLQGQRDRNADRVGVLENFLQPIAVERAVDSFLAENKEKFPDLTREDFEDVPEISPEYLTRHATRLQTRFQQVAQAKVHKIENPDVPKMSITEKNAELEDMRQKRDPKVFQRFLQHQQAA